MIRVDKRKGYDPVTIVIYDRKKDVVTRDISLLAFHRTSGKVLEVGEAAARLLHQEDENIAALCPLKNGEIADAAPALAMFRMLLQKAGLQKSIRKPEMAVCVPAGSTEVECRAFQDVFYQAGARKVILLDGPAEQMVEKAPPSCRIIVGIVCDTDTKEKAKKEKWNEVCVGAIPSGEYQETGVHCDTAGVTAVLSGGGSCVKINFHGACAMRTMDKEAVPDDFYAKGELERFRKNKFQNVIYQIEDGTFLRAFLENGRGILRFANQKNYILVSKNSVTEVIAEGPPDVVVTRGGIQP